ncbi:MAG: hypothetical protein MPL62_11275 [Alphaproteobacteria bacterium]|nr:hypothetical protein [Alphaproteobacteria bacterium]MDA8009025.1 hypothetical protein [Alphaproteobacteria bacterium]
MLCYNAGIRFWKTGSRKLFVVKAEDVHRKVKGKGRKLPILLYSDDEDDDIVDFGPPKRRKSSDVPHEYSHEVSHDLSLLRQSVEDMQKDLKSVLTLTPKCSVPLALKRILRDTFQCAICMSTPMAAPVIYTRCCKRILGCQTCVDRWYAGEEGRMKSCPICRSDRAYAETSILKGIDEFLQAITPILSGDQELEAASVRSPLTSAISAEVLSGQGTS